MDRPAPLRRTRLLVATAAAAILGLATAPAALAQAVKTTDDLTGVVVTCPNENVTFSGTAMIVETATSTPSGKSVAHLQLNLSGLTAVGQSSGTRYRVVGVSSSGFSFSIGTPQTASASRFTQTWLLVPLDGGTPLSFHEVLTVVYNATGDLVAIVSQPRRLQLG